MKVYRPSHSSQHDGNPGDCVRFRSGILATFKSGKSLAILGGAGSGKTYMLNHLLTGAATLAGGTNRVAACAFSNSAASNIGGCTIHSLFGAPASWEWSKAQLWESVRRKPGICRRLMNISILFMDEVFSIKSNEIEAIDFVLRQLTDSEEDAALPLGGRQLVAAGDPFQIEPPGVDDDTDNMGTFFESRVWFLSFTGYGDGVVALLNHNHRQKDDMSFYNMLQRIRYGSLFKRDISLLNKSSSSGNIPPLHYTRLCLLNEGVCRINADRIDKLLGMKFCFHALDSFTCSDDAIESTRLRLNQVAPHTLVMKVNCLVVLTRKCGNLLPGTCCKVIDVSVGKEAVWELRNVRVRIVASGSEITAFREPFNVTAVTYHVHTYDRKVVGRRLQLPFVPAYAMTIHKSQGLSLNTVAIDFGAVSNWRPNAMVYVALSRCRNLDGAWVNGLTRDHIRVSRRARALMEELNMFQSCFPDRFIGEKALREYFEDVKVTRGDIETFDMVRQTKRTKLLP